MRAGICDTSYTLYDQSRDLHRSRVSYSANTFRIVSTDFFGSPLQYDQGRDFLAAAVGYLFNIRTTAPSAVKNCNQWAINVDDVVDIKLHIRTAMSDGRLKQIKWARALMRDTKSTELATHLEQIESCWSLKVLLEASIEMLENGEIRKVVALLN